MNACPCSKFSFLPSTMSCYLVCHFSGLWASLMSTLIPLRSGAGVYATLGGKKKNTKKKIKKKLWFVVQVFAFWPAVTGAVPPHQDPHQHCAFFSSGQRLLAHVRLKWTEIETLAINLWLPCGSWVLAEDERGCECFILVGRCCKPCTLDESFPPYRSRKCHNCIIAAPWRYGTDILFSRIGFDTEQLRCARHRLNALELLAASVLRYGHQS